MSMLFQIFGDYFENVKTRDCVENVILKDLERFLFTLDEIDNIYRIGDTVHLKEQINTFKSSYTNYVKELNAAIFKVEQKRRRFSLCVLFDNNRKVYVNRRINPEKDFYNYYQSVGGELETNETYESCAIRETLEESGLDIETKSLSFIAIDKYIDKTTNNLFETAIFVGYIGDKIPENKEPTKHDAWQLIELKNLKTFKLTDSLDRHYDSIKSAIISYRIKVNKKRKLEEYIKLEEEVLIDEVNSSLELLNNIKNEK